MLLAMLPAFSNLASNEISCIEFQVCQTCIHPQLVFPGTIKGSWNPEVLTRQQKKGIQELYRRESISNILEWHSKVFQQQPNGQNQTKPRKLTKNLQKLSKVKWCMQMAEGS